VASHCITLSSICICSLMCSFFVLVVIYINLGRVRLYHFIHLPNCRITVLTKVPGFCPCVDCTWSLISENALIQMNGAFQMKYCMGSHFSLKNFWLRWDLNLGLPVEKPALYPLLHKLTLWYPFLMTFILQQLVKDCWIHTKTTKKSSFCACNFAHKGWLNKW